MTQVLSVKDLAWRLIIKQSRRRLRKAKKMHLFLRKLLIKDKSIKPKKSSEKNDEASETCAKPDFSSCIQTLKSENEKMMEVYDGLHV